MKKVSVIKNTEVEVKAFHLDDFTQKNEKDTLITKVTKKELKNIAETLGLDYKEADIIFSKKLLNAYLEKR